jgi:hypothetical protein
MARTAVPSGSTWRERLAQRPVGTAGALIVVAGWVGLAIVVWNDIWSVQVAFFVAVGLLTLVLACLVGFAAVVSSHRTEPLFRPWKWLRDFENYFHWLTPLAFVSGMIFAHYYWH